MVTTRKVLAAAIALGMISSPVLAQTGPGTSPSYPVDTRTGTSTDGSTYGTQGALSAGTAATVATLAVVGVIGVVAANNDDDDNGSGGTTTSTATATNP